MLDKSVGHNGVNQTNDVLLVQCALNVCVGKGGSSIAIDGIVGPQTIGAITAFQRQNHLQADGRVDPDGPTDKQLKKAMGEEAAVFGPILGQLLGVLRSIETAAASAPARVKPSYDRVTSRLGKIKSFQSLAIAPSGPPIVTVAAFGGRPNVIGFTGVEEGAAIAALAALAFLVAAVLILITQSPAFRKAVEVRAKELDRIMRELKVDMNTGFNDALQLIVSITNESIGESNRCRKSPTFTPSPACQAALEHFGNVANRIRAQVDEVAKLIFFFAANSGRGLSVSSVGVKINSQLSRLQKNVFELQVALAEMKEKCNCPDI